MNWLIWDNKFDGSITIKQEGSGCWYVNLCSTDSEWTASGHYSNNPLNC